MGRHQLTRLRPHWAWLAVPAILIVVTLAVWGSGLVHGGGSSNTPDANEQLSISYGRNFLDRDVDDDGRVIRRDEGDDVVSEGQAYGMLIAVALDDETVFRRVWSWTKANLKRPDGLLAWRWSAGSVADPNSASDADLDAGRALVLAGTRFQAPDLSADGDLLAAAVLTHEVTAAPSDGRVLVAGNWATSVPQQVNPSYFNPRAERELGALASQPQWAALSATHRVIVAQLMADAALPPDWLQMNGDALTPTGHESAPVQFGLDAARIPVRFAESCAPEDRELAAGMRSTLQRPAEPPGIRNLDGTPAADWKHPLPLVAAAATDHAAGDEAAMHEKLDAAAALERQYPSYYGAAWVALGSIMLQTTMLGSCDD